MNETDKDIKELQRLLGPAVSDYRSLAPRGVLQNRPPRRDRFFSARSAAIAASMLVAVAVAALVALDPDDPQPIGSVAEIAISKSFPTQPSARPTATNFQRPTASLSRPFVRSTLPRNPARTGG